MEYLAYLIPAAVIGASVYFSIRSYRKNGSATQAVRINLAVVAMLFVVCAATPFIAKAASTETAAPVSDSDVAEEEPAAPTNYDPTKGIGMLAAALVTGISGIGGGIAVARQRGGSAALAVADRLGGLFRNRHRHVYQPVGIGIRRKNR